MSRKFKPLEELTIQDNFMFVKVFSDTNTAKPFLEAILKIKIQKIDVVGEAHLETDPRKKRVRCDIFARKMWAMLLVGPLTLNFRWLTPGNCPSAPGTTRASAMWKPWEPAIILTN